MILELKILTKNMKVYMHTCAKFQEHSERDVEDTSLFFFCFCLCFLVHKRLNFENSLKINIHGTHKRTITNERYKMGKKISGAQKRKKKREKEELAADMERLKLGPTELWTGLVVHHKDVFVSHVIPKLNRMDRFFFSKVNRESWDVLKYAGVNVSGLGAWVYECSSISTLELVWNQMPWGEKSQSGRVIDQAWFCVQVAYTNKLELLKWVREEKKCKWNERTINAAAEQGNLLSLIHI